MPKRLAAAATALALLAGGAAAQDISGDRAALRDEQKAVFARMFERPDDLDLMFSYALISIRLEDYEAAISTLERMLIYNRELPRVHMELGAAYYRLGSYTTAGYYFNNVLAFADVPPEVVAKANEFLRAIAQRAETSVIAGSVSSGVAYASNATLGPDDPTVQLFGLPAVLADEFLEDDDFGLRTSAGVSHYYDLGQPDSDFWRTDASLFSLHYLDAADSDVDSLQVRTGPQISLDERQFGPKLRPFVEAEYVRSGNDALYATGALGAEYSDTLSDSLSIFGAIRAGWRDYFNGRDEFDGASLRASAGFAWIPAPDLVFRGGVFLDRQTADSDFNSNLEATARASLSWSYDSGFAFAERRWNLTGFAQVTGRFFDDPDPTLVGATGTRARRDVDLRGGLRHTFYLSDGVWIAAEADALLRDSNIRNFDLQNVGASISVGLDF